MCLVLLASQSHPYCLFICIANRDEFRQRKAIPVHFWQIYPDILAGWDVQEEELSLV